MTRYMGIDYGEKRVGIAISDPTRIIAQPLLTISNISKKYLNSEIKKIVEEKKIVKIVIGLPITFKGEDSEKTGQVRKFIQNLKKEITIDIVSEDERFTTKIAHRTIRQLGKKPSRYKEKVDQLAAQVILQSFLDKENLKKENIGEFNE